MTMLKVNDYMPRGGKWPESICMCVCVCVQRILS